MKTSIQIHFLFSSSWIHLSLSPFVRFGIQYTGRTAWTRWQINNSNWTAYARVLVSKLSHIRRFQLELQCSVICITILNVLKTHMRREKYCFFSLKSTNYIDCDLCARNNSGGPPPLLKQLRQWQSASENKHNWLRIRDDYRFIHKMMGQRTNAGHILKQWINSIPFIIRFE